MKTKISWFSLIVFAALTFIFFFQQGHAIGGNTWFYTHKAPLTIASLVGAFISGFTLRKNTN